LALVIRHKPEQYGHVPDGGMPIFKETVQFVKKRYPFSGSEFFPKSGNKN